MEKIVEENLRQSLSYIHPDWKPIFKSNIKVLRNALTSVVDDTPLDKIAPPLKNVFRAFIIKPKDVKVVIIGQDPYPKKGDANGLAFSTNSDVTPASLKNIFKCLNRHGYDTESNNLMNWVMQGVLLINMSLTTEVGSTKKHSGFWFPFTSEVLSSLTVLNKNRKMSILLWGNDAQRMESYLKCKHVIQKWTHPSPMADCQLMDDKKFINCDNFDNLKHINWSTGKTIHIYTDGSGRVGADCASAVYIRDIMSLTLIIRPNVYNFASDSIEVDDSDEKIPTTQRAEYLAIIYALWIVFRLNLQNVELITDSHNAYGIIVEWTKRKEEKYENADLVKIMRHLYDRVKKSVTIRRVLSHGKSNSEYSDGNNVADKLAYSHFKENNGKGNYTLNYSYESTEVYI